MGTQTNPYVLSLGKMAISADYNKTYYAEFTAEDAGDYRIKLRNVAGDELTTLQIKCTINGNVYGFSNWVWYYAGEIACALERQTYFFAAGGKAGILVFTACGYAARAVCKGKLGRLVAVLAHLKQSRRYVRSL